MTPYSSPESYHPSEPAVTAPENNPPVSPGSQTLFPPRPALKNNIETLKEKIQQKALLGLAQCARGYVACEKKETFDIGPDGEKMLRGTVITRKRVGPDLAAIQFILTNLNPAAWQLKPSPIPLSAEEEPDLSELSVQTLEELAGWIQKNTVEEKPVPQRLHTPCSQPAPEATELFQGFSAHAPSVHPPTGENSDAPSTLPIDPTSSPLEDPPYEKNECSRSIRPHRSIEPATPENKVSKQTASIRQSTRRKGEPSAPTPDKHQLPDASQRTLDTFQRELPLFTPPDPNLSNKDDPTIRLPPGQPSPMA